MRDRSKRIINAILVILIVILLIIAGIAAFRIAEIHNQRKAEAEERRARREQEHKQENEAQQNSESVKPSPTRKPTPTPTPVPSEEQAISSFLDEPNIDYTLLPEYAGLPYCVVNDDKPFFIEDDLSQYMSGLYEVYSPHDLLGRCGMASAIITRGMMPLEDREPIGSIKPSGWHTVKYPELIEDRYLYNRCHLIAYCLTGQNANERNLITGTRYLNVKGMLPFEREVASYLDYSDNHVAYRVTPIFNDYELVARGVLMEAYSIEDNGFGISFNVFVYNVQPGIMIDYATGDSYVSFE